MDLPTTHYDVPAEAAVKVEQRPSLLKKISSYIVLAAIFLAPLVFIPSAFAPLDVVKSFFISFAILLATLLYAIDAVRSKSFSVPKSIIGYSAILIALSTIISSFASGNLSKSFIGQGFELTSASTILLMILSALVISRLVKEDSEMTFKIYSAIFLSFILLAIFHIARFIGGADFLSFGVLKAVTSTVAGKWYDFAILTAAIGLLSLIGIKFLPLRKSLKRVLYASLLACGVLLFYVNSAFIWALFAFAVLLVGIYEFSIAQTGEGKKFISKIPLLTLIVFVIAGGLAWKGGDIAGKAVAKIDAQYGELVLPWQMTLDVTTGTLKESPVFGVGPNRFGLQYLKFKPIVINQTPFWNAEFTGGFGLIPTIVVNQGILGALVWILFLAFFVREGIRALRRVNDSLRRFFITSSFFAALFLWTVNLVYVPSHVTLFLTAIFTGVFIALCVSENTVMEKEISMNSSAKISKLVPVAMYASIIVIIVWAGVYAQKAVAMTYFHKGIKELSTSRDANKAQEKFMKALSWSNSDVFYQALSETNIMKINALAQEIQREAQTGAAPDKAKSDQLVALISDSLKYTQVAKSIDEKNYYNHLAEARISEIGTSLKIENAYANAKNAYSKAINNNPYNPALYLNLARLEASQGNFQDAQQFIGRSLQLKQNYIEAIFFLSQLQVANNQLKDAKISTSVAIQLNPNEPLLYFQLGLLEYNDKNYTGAITALEKAVNINAEYANAKYFLGLSYARMGNMEGAIKQFEDLSVTNPDNQEVSFILGNLKEGKSPFADAQPPIDNKPEKRKTLPVTEKSDSSQTTTAAKKSS